jgi:predicted small lipoprotein YifL
MRSRLQLVTALVLSASVAASLSACGVRGSLESPPEAKTSEAPRKPGEPAPHKPSILDPLIR